MDHGAVFETGDALDRRTVLEEPALENELDVGRRRVECSGHLNTRNERRAGERARRANGRRRRRRPRPTLDRSDAISSSGSISNVVFVLLDVPCMGFTLIFIGTSLVLVLVLLPKRRETLRTFYSNNWFKNSRVLSLVDTRTHVCDEETWVRDGGTRCTRRAC